MTYMHAYRGHTRQSEQDHAQITASDLLIRQRRFAQKRYRWSFTAALVAALAGAILAIILFSGTDRVPLYTGFQSWDHTYTSGDTTDTTPVIETHTLGDYYRTRGESFHRYVDDFWQLDARGDIAGVSRFVAVVIAGILTLRFYRELLDEAYTTQLAHAQRAQWRALQQTPQHLLATFIVTGVVMLTTYVVTSALWLLLASMFAHAALNLSGTVILTAWIVGLTGFAVMHMVPVLSTHRLFLLLLLSNGVGLCVMFVIARPMINSGVQRYWWQLALSSLGKQPGTDIMWSFGFITLFLVLYVLWLDISGYLRIALSTPEPVHRWQYVWGSAFNRIRFLYFFAAFSLLSVGLIPVNHATRGMFILTFTLHSMGAAAAILIYWLGGIALVTKRLRNVVFVSGFVTLSQAAFFAILGAGFMLVIGEFNMAMFELVMFVISGIWLYAATDQLVWYSNLQALELEGIPAGLARLDAKKFTRGRQRPFGLPKTLR